MSDTEPQTTPATLNKWMGILGAVVAPTTIITGLCYYFGYTYTRTKLAYFGIDCDAIGFTSSDYMVGSVSVLYAPLLLLLTGWFAAVWLGAYTSRLIESGRHLELVRTIGRTGLIVGLVLIGTGVLGVMLLRFTPRSVFVAWAFSPIALGAGGLLVAVGYWIAAATGPTERTPNTRIGQILAIAVSLVAAFSLAHTFATSFGENAAQTVASDVWSRESVVTVVSKDRIDVPGNLVAETLVQAQPGTPNAYRYQCLRTLVARKDMWVLIPAKWSPSNGFTLIVPTGSTVVSISRSSDFEKVAEANPIPKNVSWQCPERAPQQP